MTVAVDAYLESQYNLRLQHPAHHHVKASSHRRSEWVREHLPMQQDLICGTAAASRFDVIPGNGDPVNQPAVVFIHGGFWRSGDKSECAFLAQPFHRHGISTVLLNYSLAPATSLEDIIHEVRSSFFNILGQMQRLGMDPGSIVVGGHSAGGHLAAMVASTVWSDYGLSQSPIKASFGLSGLYDPRPLARTSFQPILALPAASAHLVARPTGTDAEVQGLDLVACGTKETAELQAQTRRYAEQVRTARNRDSLFWVEGIDHYSILPELAELESGLFRRVLGLFRC